MNILAVSRERLWPAHSGAVQRSFHLISGLARTHRVTLASLVSPRVAVSQDPYPLREVCDEVIEISQQTCVFHRSGLYNDWAPATKRLAALAVARLPRSVQRWQSDELVARLAELRARGRFDAVWAERTYMAEAARRAGFERIVVDLPDLESVAMHRALSQSRPYKSKPIDWAEWRKLHRYEQSLTRRYWRLSVCKPEDRDFFERQAEG